MKKCSKSAHASLTELSITPLLDLAFVLLIIFVITTPLLEQSINLKLPVASKHQKDPPRKATYLSLQADGKLSLNTAEIPLNNLLQTLISLRTDDPDLNIIVRGDAKVKYKQIRAVLDICQQANIVKVDLATEILK